MLPWVCTTPVIHLLLRGLHRHGSKKWQKCSRSHVFQGVREQKGPQMRPWICKHPLYAFCEGVCTSTGAKSGKNAPEVMFFKGVGSKNARKCSRGFASTLYTPSVEGSAQAREQKRSKMLPWSCTTPDIRFLLRGLHRHGSKNGLKRSRGVLFGGGGSATKCC